jgi:hypothetical protein
MAAALIGVLTVASTHWISETMMTVFHDEYRSTLGRTLSDRVATFLDNLPSNDRLQLARDLSAKTQDPLVKMAIEAQATIGSFYNGTGEAITNELLRSGVPSDRIAAERDKIVLTATKDYLLTVHPVLIRTIWEDVVRGFASADNAIIALSPFCAHLSGAVDKIKRPEAWLSLEALPSLDILEATRISDAAARDTYVNFGSQIPLGILMVCVILLGVAGCIIHRELPRAVLAGWSALAAGVLVFVICMAGVFYLERYALPLLITTVFGLLASLAPLQIHARESD